MENSGERQMQHPLANYQFSYDELRVLRECNKESFFQRSVPFSVGLGTATYFAINRNFLKAHPKFGAVPKVVVAAIVGYFIGKFSYQEKCAQKLMQLPNSKLAEILRERSKHRGLGNFAPDQKLGVGIAIAPFTSGAQEDTKLDADFRVTNSGLDDAFRPTVDSSPYTYFETELPIEESATKLSYEELRKKNRDTYNGKQEPARRTALPAESSPTLVQVPEQHRKTANSNIPEKTNKYGDVWTD